MKFEQNLKKRIATCGLVAGFVLFSLQAKGAANITNAEIAMLPPYCEVKLRSKDPVAIQPWVMQFGHDNWIHMHHYCDALVEMKRAYRLNANERKGALHNAVWQFDYMLSHTQPDFFMRPDFHYGKGLALQLQNNDGAAIAEFQKTLAIKADSIPALTELAKLYTKIGKKDMALSVLKQGLEKSPANKGLRRRFQELGGDLSTIPEAVAAPPNESSRPPEGDGKMAEQAATKAGSTPENNQAVIPPFSGQKIGNKNNPWCRFCTDEPPVENK
ncbi:MAG: hypothetical protein C3F18_00420 [Nitrosomonadales bacterium]|nr:MAG: hypothetical protein C3F18_00420 [Nitrosomonadales bacterium]